MIGRKGKCQNLPRRYAWDYGSKIEKASSGKKKTKGGRVVKPGLSHGSKLNNSVPGPSYCAKSTKQPVSPYVKGADPAPAPPCVKDDCVVDPLNASGSCVIREVVYDAAGLKINLFAISPDALPPGALDEDLFSPCPPDGAEEIASDEDFEVVYTCY